MAKTEIRALTSLRGIAAMAVVLQHYSASAEKFSQQWIPSLAPHGYMAVDFFFVLSGFILAYTYADEFLAENWRAYPSFIMRRIARVWPLQVAVVLFLAALHWLSINTSIRFSVIPNDTSGWDILSNILFLHGFGIGNNLNGPSATISQELGAYALFPILLAIALHRKRWIAILAAILAITLIGWQATQEPRLGLVSRETFNMVFRCLAEFTLGLCAYRVYRSSSARWFSANWLAVTLSGACAVSLILRVDLPAALMFAPLVLAFACNTGWPARLVSHRALYFLGVISYSIYLIHSPIRFIEFGILQQLHPEPFSPVAALLLAAFGALTPLPLAWLTYRWIEQPGRDLFRNFPRSRRTAMGLPPS
jgi:peptidoglycan/LPS O-acetylase OafA/YrhL